MPTLTVRNEQRFWERGQAVVRMLQPITQRRGGPAWAPKSIGTSTIVIATHDGSPPVSEYRDWRFATVASGFNAMYHERWSRRDKNLWELERAYLNIYKHSGVDEIEFLCLHCDPLETDTAPHARYKQGPHLHVSIAGEPIKHSHLAIHGGLLDAVLQSVATLSNTMDWAVQMIRDEVLDAITDQS